VSDIKVVWALFDSETCTVAKALPECEVYSFGKGSGTEHIELDLSDFEKAKKTLDNYPKPDVIFASPPCESWVVLSAGSLRFFTKEKGYNLFWKCKWHSWDFTQKHKETRLNGINTADCLAKIIQHYKPEFWAIENGNTSLVFDYMKENCGLEGGIKNKCNYYSYGFRFLKRTIIYSNAKLLLKNMVPRFLLGDIADSNKKGLRELKKRHGIVSIKSNKEASKIRSLVPTGLYKDIMRQFRHGGQPCLFD
jgi:hypothetical protein